MNLTPTKHNEHLRNLQYEVSDLLEKKDIYQSIIKSYNEKGYNFSHIQDALIWAIASNKIKHFLKVKEEHITNEDSRLMELSHTLAKEINEKITEQVFLQLKEELTYNWD